jgi:hypothetical protein
MISAPGFSANTKLPKRYVDFYEATGTPERGRGHSLVTLRCGMPKKTAFPARSKERATFCEQDSRRFFEKKRRKKLLFGGACDGETSTAQFKKVFAPLFPKSGHFPGV